MLVEQGFFFLFVILLPIVAYAFIHSYSFFPIYSDLFWFLALLYLAIAWDMFFYGIMIYALNTLIVTDKRVLDSQQKGFFQYTLNEVERDKIQDISIHMNGLFASLFHYGDMEIQSAGAQAKFYFKKIPNPQKVKEIMMGR